MSTEEKLEAAIKALQAIIDFGHTDDCGCKGAPIYECGCYDKSQWQIAKEALLELE